MSRLVLGRDTGGRRWFLDGQQVHCGQGLELELWSRSGCVWAGVRFEMAPNGSPVVYLALPDEGQDLALPWNETMRFRFPRSASQRAERLLRGEP